MENIFKSNSDNSVTVLKDSLIGLHDVYSLFGLDNEIRIYHPEFFVLGQELVKIYGSAAIWLDHQTLNNDFNYIEIIYDVPTLKLHTFNIYAKPLILLDNLNIGYLKIRNIYDCLIVRMIEPGQCSGLFDREFRIVFGMNDSYEFQCSMRRYSDLYYFSAETSGLSIGNITDLFSNKKDSLEDFVDRLPDTLEIGNKIEVVKVSFEYEYKFINAIQFISTQLKFPDFETWWFYPGFEFLKITELSALFQVRNPFSKTEKQVNLYLSGILIIDVAHVLIQVKCPETYIQGQLKKGDTIPLGLLLSKLGLPVAGPTQGDNQLSISDLSFSAEPAMPDKSFAFRLTVDNVWKFNLNSHPIFALKSITANISCIIPNEKEEEKILEASMLATMVIGEGYELMAGVDYNEKGWHIRAWSVSELDLYSLVNDLMSTLQADFELPHALQQLVLSNVSVEYDTGSGRFELSGRFNDPWLLSTGNEEIELKYVEFALEYDRTSGFDIAFNGLVELKAGNKTIDIEVSYQYEKGRWTLDGQAEAGEEDLTLQDLADHLTQSKKNAPIPSILNNPKINLLGVHLEKSGGQYQFSTTAQATIPNFPTNEFVASVILHLSIENNSGNKELNIAGTLHMADENGFEHVFKLQFFKDKAIKSFLAYYQGDFPLSRLLTLFGDNAVGKALPNWMNPSLQGVALLLLKEENYSTIAVLDLNLNLPSINLKEMELIGSYLGDAPISGKIKIQVRSESIRKNTISKSAKAELEKYNIKIPDEDMSKGFDVSIQLDGKGLEKLIKDPDQLAFNFSKTIDDGSHQEIEPHQEAKTKWQESKTQIGPVYINKIGLTVEDGKLKLLMDAGLKMGTFQFDMMGLGVKIPLKTPFDIHQVELGMDGLGLQYSNSSFKLAGAFLAQKVKYEGQVCTGYFGEAQLKVGDKIFKAIGCYIHPSSGQVNEKGDKLQPSFFLFAVANIPIGGPDSFFITGFAGGFGINSSLRIPNIDSLKDFILLRVAFDEEKFDNNNPGQNIARIQQDIVPAVGSYWLAGGIKVRHFGVVEAFYLITFELGQKVDVNLLGLMRLNLPSPGDRIAKAELAIRGRYEPELGALKIEGRISPGSYILNPMAKLAGGMAFYSWMGGEYAGDFVFSMGGYHPKFVVPPHYPKVPRLSMTWQLSKEVLIKGEMYFAVTPSVLMTGGRLEAHMDIGAIEAWFIAEAHFLLNFSPLYYNATMAVSMGCKATLDLLFVTVTKTFSFTAELELWGPEFGGYAKIDLSVVEFEVSFGEPKSPPKPLEWVEFQKQFLPPAENTLQTSISNGLIKDFQGNPEYGDIDWIANAGELMFVLESAVPITGFDQSNNFSSTPIAKKNIGITPVNLPAGHLDSTLEIQIYGDKNKAPAFEIVEVKKSNVPHALWGGTKVTSLNSNQGLIKETLSGVVFSPLKSTSIKQTEVDLETLGYNKPAKPINPIYPKLFELEVDNTSGLVKKQDIKVDLSSMRDCLAEDFGMHHLAKSENWDLNDNDLSMYEVDKMNLIMTGLLFVE